MSETNKRVSEQASERATAAEGEDAEKSGERERGRGREREPAAVATEERFVVNDPNCCRPSLGEAYTRKKRAFAVVRSSRREKAEKKRCS